MTTTALRFDYRCPACGYRTTITADPGEDIIAASERQPIEHRACCPRQPSKLNRAMAAALNRDCRVCHAAECPSAQHERNTTRRRSVPTLD